VSIEKLKSLGVSNLLLMHGFQAYPTDIDNSHIDFIATLESIFGLPVGYQDHVDAESELSKITPLLAMAKGAVLLEKHVTDCRSRKGTDYESALELTEFSGFIDLVNKGYLSFGSGNIRPFSDQECEYRQNFKKTIVSSRDIEKGEVITKDMLLFMRADQGYSPNYVNEIIGLRSSKFICKFETIKSDHIKSE
jgi:sialic acid synthase SpsE